MRRPGPSALLFPAPPEPRDQAAQPALELLARVGGDPADRIVGLDDPQLIVRRAHGAPSGDRLGGLRAVARAAGLGDVDLRLQAGDVVVGISVAGVASASSVMRRIPAPLSPCRSEMPTAAAGPLFGDERVRGRGRVETAFVLARMAESARFPRVAGVGRFGGQCPANRESRRRVSSPGPAHLAAAGLVGSRARGPGRPRASRVTRAWRGGVLHGRGATVEDVTDEFSSPPRS